MGAIWTRLGDQLWVDRGEPWSGRTCTVDPDDPANREAVPLGYEPGATPVRFRDPGPNCPSGWCSPPCPWDLRWPTDVVASPEAVLQPWWERFGPGAPPGQPLGPPLGLKEARFATHRRRAPEDGGSPVEPDPVGGTCRQARAHVAMGGVLVEALHTAAETRVEQSGTLLGLALPMVAQLKDFASEATKRVHRLDARALLPAAAIVRVEATARFSTIRPMLGQARAKYDAHGRGPLDRATIELTLHDGWRTHVVTLRQDGESSGYAYDPGPIDLWLSQLEHVVEQQRRGPHSTAGWESASRWWRRIEVDHPIPLCIPGELLGG